MRSRGDWVSVIQAAYEPAADDRSWAREVVDAMRRVVPCGDAVQLHVVEHDPECLAPRVLVNVGRGPVGETLEKIGNAGLAAITPPTFRAFYYPPAMVTTHSELDPLLAAEQRELAKGVRKVAGLPDLVGVVAHPEPGLSLVLSYGLDRPMTPTRHERALLSRIGLHLESAYRLRRRPEVVKGVLTLSGARRHRTADAPADETLREQARRIELSLSKKGRDQHEAALDLWTALVGGRYSLVSRTENGSRRYLVLENSPRSHDMRALTQRELDVLSMAARGLSTKLVSYGLGLSPGTVSTALSRAASKLGLASHLELLRLAAALSHDPRSCSLPSTLTAAETEVLELLREGLSNQQIGRLRSRSARTVANQVASLLRKTDSGSRRALVTDAWSVGAKLSSASRNNK